MRRRPLVLIPAALVVTLALAVGQLLFQPWKLFVDQRVDESLPQATSTTHTGPRRRDPGRRDSGHQPRTRHRHLRRPRAPHHREGAGAHPR